MINLRDILLFIILVVISISLLKIAFYGIDINNASVETIIKKDIVINKNSAIKILGKDINPIEDAPLWVHIETPNEYNDRINKVIKYHSN